MKNIHWLLIILALSMVLLALTLAQPAPACPVTAPWQEGQCA